MSLARIRFTDRLRLEPVGLHHADDLLTLYQDPAVAEWFGDWTRGQIEREVARMATGWRVDGAHKWMAYHGVTGAVVGRGGLSRKLVDGRDRWEIGWVLHHRFWGQGYASEIGRAGLALAFDELDAEEVVSFTEARNHRSRAVMERLGFRYSKNVVIEGESFVLYRRERVPA